MKGVGRCIGVYFLIFFYGCFFAVPLAESQTDRHSTPSPGPEEATGQIDDIPDWKARLELAKLLTYAKRYPEAIKAYEKVLKERPGLLEAKIELAKAYFWSGKNDRALQLFQSIPPGELDELSQLALADLYIATKDYPRAEKRFTDYLNTHPRDHKVRLKLAQVLSWMKRYDEAIAQYRQLTQALPDDREVRKKYAFVLIWAGKQDEAIRELQNALPD